MNNHLLDLGLNKVSFGPWNLNLHSKTLIVSENEKRVLLAYLSDWAKVYPKDPETLVQKNFAVPSVIVRFDYVVSDQGVHVYEIEDRPALIPIGSIINPQFGEKIRICIDKIRKNLGRPVSVVVSPSRFENSDDLLHHLLPTPIFDGVYSKIEDVPHDHVLIVRSERDEEEYYQFEDRSLSTVSEEGWKGYGVLLGLWKKIYQPDVDFDSSFVVKPNYGCRSDNVHLFHPNRKSKGKHGFSTRGAVTKAIEEAKVHYIQEYFEPEHHDFLPEDFYLIRRVYFGFDVEINQYECIGGVYMARTCAKVHGASDTVTGSILV
jgi:hypothetical protein